MSLKEKLIFSLANIPLPEETIYNFLAVLFIGFIAVVFNYILIYPARYTTDKFFKTPKIKTKFTLPGEIKKLDELTKKKQKILASLKLLISYNYQFDKELSDLNLLKPVRPKTKAPSKAKGKPPAEIKINIKLSAIIYIPKKRSVVKLNKRVMKEGDVLDFGFINNIPCTLKIVEIKKGCVEILLRKGKKEISKCLKPGDYVL
jgi:hypothetical protein